MLNFNEETYPWNRHNHCNLHERSACSIHGIIIATPTHMHKDLVVRGLRAGKAVLCEKPIAENLQETRICYQIAQKV